MSRWEVTPFNEPYRYPWIITNGSLVFGVGEKIIAFETQKEAQSKADELNAIAEGEK